MSIGEGWADGAWVDAGWASGAWAAGASTAPTVDAGGPYAGDEDVATALDATVTPGSDPSPSILWEIVSGGTGTFSDDATEDPTFTPDDVAVYTLRLTVTPSDGDPVVDSATFVVTGAGAGAHASRSALAVQCGI